MLQYIIHVNPSKPRGYYMYHLVYHFTTVHSAYRDFFVYTVLKTKSVRFLNSIILLISVQETQCVSCDV
jgi:hypothetical protein